MKKKLLLLTGFPLGALKEDTAVLKVRRLTSRDVEVLGEIIRKGEYEVLSYIGHQATAALLQKLLGIEVGVNRERATLGSGDMALVVTLKVRLPVGKEVADVEELKNVAEFFLVEILPAKDA